MFLHCQADASLSTRDALFISQLNHSLIIKITLNLNTHATKSTLADSRSSHRNISHDGSHLTATQRLINATHRSFVCQQTLLHFKISGGVNSMKQCPLTIKRNILVSKFTFYSAETLYHYVLPHSGPLFLRLTIISTRSNHLALPAIRPGITDDDNGEHIHLFRVEFAQSRHNNSFAIATSLTDISHRSIGITNLEHKFLQTMQLPIPLLAFRIINRCNEIAISRSFDSALNLLPRSHQVGQRDDTKVMAHRSTKQRRRFLESADPGKHNNLNITTTFALHLPNQRSHAIDARVARTHHTHSLTLFSKFKRLFRTVALTFHSRVHTFCPLRQTMLYIFKVEFVAYHHVTHSDSISHSRCHILHRTRAYANNYNPILHNQSLSIRI